LVFLHSDGAVSELIPDLLEIGLSVLNPLQPEVMDLAQLKREYGRDLRFLVFLCLYVPVTWSIWSRPERPKTALVCQP
jgi:hypothetical protein